MKTIEEIADKHGGLPVVTKSASGLEIGGVFVGQEVQPGVFMEQVASCRYLLRSSIGATHPLRMGEVMGSSGKFISMLMNGAQVGVSGDLKAAIDLLLEARGVKA